MRRPVAVLLVSLLALAACGDDDDPVVEGGGATSSSSTASTGTSTSTTEAPSGNQGSGLPASGETSTTRAYLKAVRVASHDGYDRVVFEFEDAVPGYTVDTTQRPVRQDGSGDEVKVEGDTLVEARFDNAASARIEGEKVVPVYEGPKRVEGPKGGVVTEVVFVGDFEGVVTWVIGLEEGAGAVKVSTLQSPYRVVVDVRTDS